MRIRLPADEMQKVSFLEPVPYTQMPDFLRSSGIFINSSLWEAFPLSILEAIASGLPVVASEVSGIPEVIRHGETGLLFQPGDPESLAEAIIRLFEDEELRCRLRINAMQEIKGKFYWEIITEELWLQYQSLLLKLLPALLVFQTTASLL